MAAKKTRSKPKSDKPRKDSPVNGLPGMSRGAKRTLKPTKRK
jgi:hypothetical protein